MNTKDTIKWFWRLLIESYKDLKQNDPLRLSSSTAFFAMFSIIPIIILLLDLFGTIFSERLLKDEMLESLQQMLGNDAASYLSGVLQNVQNMQQGGILTLGIVVFLIFIATTLFQIVHNSFNQIWRVKAKKDTDFRFILINRGLSLLIILIGGILFLFTFLFDITLAFIGENILTGSEINLALIKILNTVFSLVVFTVWLAVIYKYLTDVILPWKPVWIGSFITALLLLIGQFIIGKAILAGNLNTIYGASASMVIMLLFIFYCSFILYYGLCLIKKYTEEKNYRIESAKFAVRYEINELE